MQAAVLAEVAEVEERRRMKQLRVSRSSEKLRPQTSTESDHIDNDSAPTGLGIAESLRARAAAEAPAKQEPSNAQQGQVVVNVGGAPSGGGEMIERLAAYVADGRDYERDARRRSVVKMLRATSATEEEERTAVSQLDDAVLQRVKSGQSAVGSGVTKIAHMAFDRLAGMLGKGD